MSEARNETFTGREPLRIPHREPCSVHGRNREDVPMYMEYIGSYFPFKVAGEVIKTSLDFSSKPGFR